jgi:transposase
METLYFLGIDLAKKTFQAALTIDGVNMHEVTVENSVPAIEAFFRNLKNQFSLSGDRLIVGLEHTGIYGLPLLDYLSKQGIKVCVESPLQIKQSQGMKRGKNDKVDARRIAQYVYKNRLELRFWKPQRQVIQKLKALLIVRERMVRAKHQFEVPLSEQADYVDQSIKKLTAKSCQTALKGLKTDIKNIEKQIDLIIKEDAQLSNQMRLATSVPGIGKITAANVIVHTDEFTRINNPKKFACYSGVAPFEHSSGISVRGKTRVSKLAIGQHDTETTFPFGSNVSYPMQ